MEISLPRRMFESLATLCSVLHVVDADSMLASRTRFLHTKRKREFSFLVNQETRKARRVLSPPDTAGRVFSLSYCLGLCLQVLSSKSNDFSTLSFCPRHYFIFPWCNADFFNVWCLALLWWYHPHLQLRVFRIKFLQVTPWNFQLPK